jgi:hypothetical protein
MQDDLKFLEDKLKKLDDEIEEVKSRMPAHSVKPPIMMELFALEEVNQSLCSLRLCGEHINRRK